MIPFVANRPSPPAHRAILSDLALVAAFTAAVLAASVRWEWHEDFSRWVSRYERWQADELPVALLALACGLVWFALRRAAQARAEAAERLRAERRVADLLVRNRELARQMIRLQESERRALARELHDELGQTCNAIRVEAACILKSATADDAARAAAGRIAGSADGLVLLIRDMLRRLRPAALENLGLVPALQELCEGWEEQSGIACRFIPADLGAEPDDAVRIAVYRLVQESLTNVLRHAEAATVTIRLGVAGPTLHLKIEDDGRGMADPDGVGAGFGLLGMRERVASLGGWIRFRSSPGCGLGIEAELPAGGLKP